MCNGLGKSLIMLGIGIALLGLVLFVVERWSSPAGALGGLGRLPGDILIKRDNFVLYVPLASSILISVILTLVITLVSLFLKR